MPGTPMVSNSDKTLLGVWGVSSQIGDRRGINSKLLCGCCHEEFKKGERMSSFYVFLFILEDGQEGQIWASWKEYHLRWPRKCVIPHTAYLMANNPESGWESRSSCQLAGCIKN